MCKKIKLNHYHNGSNRKKVIVFLPEKPSFVKVYGGTIINNDIFLPDKQGSDKKKTTTEYYPVFFSKDRKDGWDYDVLNRTTQEKNEFIKEICFITR